MTLEEKLQPDPAALRRPDQRRPDVARQAGVGGVFSLVDPAEINEYQHVAVEQSRLHIPILFAYDTIHGYRTIFPIPLGAASSFDPNVASQDHKFGARESAAVGLKQIYSPMVDVSHEPRWGRISEAGGEDPYLNSVMRGRAREGRAGPRLLRARQGRHERQALRRLRPAGGRARLQHDRHVRAAAAQPLPAAVQGRDRRRRRHRDVLVQRDQRRPGLREQRDSRPTSSRRSGASTASSRATTPPSPSCDLPRTTASAVRPRRPPTPGRRAGAQRRHRLRDGLDAHPRQRRAAARRRAASRCRASTTPCAGSCA